MEGLQDDMGDGSMQCADHPYKNNVPPGGICAFCLQEKLGKLVSSSFPIAVFPSSSPSSSPSFRSASAAASAVSVRPNGSSSSSSTVNAENNSDCHHHHQYYARRARIPFLLTSQKKKKKKKKKDLALAGAAPEQASMVFKRSKSTTTPGRGVHFMGLDDGENEYSPRKRGFWSFLYLSKHSTTRRIDKPNCKEICYSSSSTTMGSFSQRTREATTKRDEFAAAVVEEEENDDSPNQAAAFDRKVSRSRSVGCGSRSFSGDFFERISTGFGDCTLRRVESHREGKPKVTPVHGRSGGGGQDCIKERVKCGGLFSGFMITSSSSSSSSSYWVSSSAEDNNMNGKAAGAAAAATPAAGHLAHGRSRSWGWAFASPIRAFSKPSSGRREGSNANKNTTPNLNAIPSLLAVRG